MGPIKMIATIKKPKQEPENQPTPKEKYTDEDPITVIRAMTAIKDADLPCYDPIGEMLYKDK